MRQLVTAYVLVPTDDWQESEALVATVLTDAGMEVQAVKWEGEEEDEDEEEDEWEYNI